MSRGFDGFDIDDFAIPNRNPNTTAPAGNQAREEAVVHSLEAPSDPNWKTYFRGWTLTPKFTFSVFRCSVYVEGVFSFFSLSAWWKYFARIPTSYRTQPTDDAPKANVDLTPLR